MVLIVVDRNLNFVFWITDDFTAFCGVVWPLKDSEAGDDLVLTKTSLLLFCKSSWAYVNPVFNLHDKSRDVDI